MLDPHTTVARTVLDHSQCAAVFQRHRIDYCCQGDRSIAEACRDRGLDPTALLGELERAIADRPGDGVDPRARSTPSLIGHIIATHHEYLRQALPFLRGLAAKVARVHGDRDPRLLALDALVAELAGALGPHLDREEEVLFPALMARQPPAGLLAAELAAMREEHFAVGALLERMRGAAGDYGVPGWACASYRTLLAELERLEADVLRHVHLENHVLMPRFA